MMMEYEQIYMLVRELLNRHDLTGLKPGYGDETSAPIDEYELETKIVARFLFLNLNNIFEDPSLLTKQIDETFRKVLVPAEQEGLNEASAHILNELSFLAINRRPRERSLICCFCQHLIDPKHSDSLILVRRNIHQEGVHEGEEIWVHDACFQEARNLR